MPRPVAHGVALAAGLTVCAACAAAQPPAKRSASDQVYFTTRVRRIAPDVYVASRPEVLRYWVEGNVTIIVNQADVVVVDASGTPEMARNVIAEIRKITRKPVRYLINTHGHGDHTLGNQAYAAAYPGVEIVAHPETYRYLTGGGTGYVGELVRSTESRKADGRAEIERLRAEGRPGVDRILANLEEYYGSGIDVRQAAYRTVTVTPPTLLVDGTLVLRRGKRTIEVRFLGKGDTPGDLVVYLPEDRIVVTGDMVVAPVPYGFSRHPLEWRETLHRLVSLEFELLVPGHGDVQRGKAYLGNLMTLHDEVIGAVREGLAAGLDGPAIRSRLDATALGAPFAAGHPVYQYYFEQYYLDPTVGRIVLELTGR
jgi:glyoxylase-like metal-dependent hydrolase (beta-lactamase superfamily II)